MAITTFQRYEIKFLLSATQMNAFIPTLLLHMDFDAFCADGMTYPIHSLYYDTPDHSLIRHSLSKPQYKEKLRLRSYGIPHHSGSSVFLELKKKICGIVNKRRVAMTLDEAYAFLKGCAPLPGDYTKEQVCHELRWFLSEHERLSPAVCISYDRLAFFGRDNPDFRLTLDRNIFSYRNQPFLESCNGGVPLLTSGQALMEIKILSSTPLWLVSILTELQIYSTSFSKYGREYQAWISNMLHQKTAYSNLTY